MEIPTTRIFFQNVFFTELTFLSAFLAGLLGTMHCIGMCGSIIGALSMSLPTKVHQSYFCLWPYLLSYNLGCISSYVVAGILVGFLGGQLVEKLSLNHIHSVVMGISGLFMIVFGLYVASFDG